MLLQQKVIMNTKTNYMNYKCFRHSMNRIQSKNHRIGTYEIKKKNYLSYFDDKVYILNNRLMN